MDTTKKAPFLWTIPLFLSLFSVIVIISSTSENAIHMTGQPYAIGIKQFIWIIAGVFAMIFCYMIPLNIFMEHSGVLWFLSLCLMLLPFMPGIGRSAGGAARWIHLAGVSVQPSEILAIFLVMHTAKKLYAPSKTDLQRFLVVLSIFFISVLPLLLQPDLGSSILLFGIVMGMVIQAQGWLFPVASSLLGFLGIIPLILFKPYRLRRVMALLDPWQDPFDLGFQTIQGLIAFANGGIAGVGIGKGMQKLHYLPATHTDYIFSSIGEEYGLLGTGTIMLLYMALAIFLHKLFWRNHNGMARTFFWGISLSLFLPVIINLSGVLNLLPLTGMPCPFLSYGGSAMITSWAKIGLLLNMVHRFSSKESFESLGS